MANGRHMKHGEKQNHRSSPTAGLPPREDPRREPRRGGSFRTTLAKEYGVEKTPREFHKKFESTLLSLPDEMPVRHRPVFYLLRNAATIAAVLAIVFTALLGVNTTYPQLTEALPGLGMVFQAINGGGERRTTDPVLPQVTPTPQPTFSPVVATGDADYLGDLRISDAWCDGKTITLDLTLDLPLDAQKSMWSYPDVETDADIIDYFCLRAQFTNYETDMVEPSYHLDASANGNEYVESYLEGLSDFVPDGQGHAKATWQAELTPEMQSAAGEELELALYLPDLTLYHKDWGTQMWWSSQFEAKFTVPVDRSSNRQFRSSVSDNGAVLLNLDYAPSLVEIDLELPFIGYFGDMLSAPDPDPENYSFYPWNDDGEGAPLGIYATLVALDDKPVPYTFVGVDSEEKEIVDGRFQVQYQFRNTGGNHGAPPLRLTVYEAIYGDKIPYSRVVAEFTIDLATGRIVPTEYYMDEGREKVDVSRRQKEVPGADGFINDFICVVYYNADLYSEREYNRDAAILALATPYKYYDRVRHLRLDGIANGMPVQSFSFLLNPYEAWSEPEGGEENGYCETQMWTLPSTGEAYLAVGITLFLPYDEEEGNYPYSQFDYLQLVDMETGEVLIYDMAEAYEHAHAAVWGGPTWLKDTTARESQTEGIESQVDTPVAIDGAMADD